MASTFWVVIGLIAVSAIVVDGIVKIIRTTKSGDGKFAERVQDLEEEIHDLRGELTEVRQRIEVLEKIVTDPKSDLSRQIDDLASNE